MSSARHAAEMVADFSAPLSPFETFDAREQRRRAWHASLDASDVDGLLQALGARLQMSGQEPAAWEAFEVELSEALVAIASRASAAVVAQVSPLLDDPRARPTAIEVLGACKDPRVIPALGQLARDPTLSREERVRLAGAVGEIGSVQGRPLLEALRAHAAEDPELANEIAIAATALDPGSPGAVHLSQPRRGR